MKILETNSDDRTPNSNVPQSVEGFLDLETIRRRVARIKNSWSPDTIRARSREGDRRRRELETLVLDVITDTSDSEEYCSLETSNFSLVG